ncbi:MAG TPA: hypothetical protein VJ327_03145 [Patescibacteria group bacterium]|nr:hypothetical protein [Patescibacteria group bacterium]
MEDDGLKKCLEDVQKDLEDVEGALKVIPFSLVLMESRVKLLRESFLELRIQMTRIHLRAKGYPI